VFSQNSSRCGHAPQRFTVSEFRWHLEEVVVLQVQRSQLLHPLQLQRVDGADLVVAEQDSLQRHDAIKDAGKDFKPSGRERRQTSESRKRGIQTMGSLENHTAFQVSV